MGEGEDNVVMMKGLLLLIFCGRFTDSEGFLPQKIPGINSGGGPSGGATRSHDLDMNPP